MVKLDRLNEVLDTYKNIFNNTIDKKNYNKFKINVLNKYKQLYELVDTTIANQYYRNFSVAVVSLYKVIHDDYGVDTKKAINCIYELTYKCTESIFLDLSFVQMAYYLICDKLYLKRLMLNSLSEFDPSEMFDFMDDEELLKNKELDSVKHKEQMIQFFKEQNVEELKPIIDLTSRIIEDFVDDNFTRKQKSFSLEDIF